MIDPRYFGLIEMLLVFGLVLAWAGWQVWDWLRWRKGQEALRAQQASEAEDQVPGA